MGISVVQPILNHKIYTNGFMLPVYSYNTRWQKIILMSYHNYGDRSISVLFCDSKTPNTSNERYKT